MGDDVEEKGMRRQWVEEESAGGREVLGLEGGGGGSGWRLLAR